mmetsp:Transcript_8879/g.18971  ORF Transcript_8879/g.18971 Transcript_8879/m.18971 type:complete len:237 (+) Transcript_8879:345-1055(+)
MQRKVVARCNLATGSSARSPLLAWSRLESRRRRCSKCRTMPGSGALHRWTRRRCSHPRVSRCGAACRPRPEVCHARCGPSSTPASHAPSSPTSVSLASSDSSMRPPSKRRPGTAPRTSWARCRAVARSGWKPPTGCSWAFSWSYATCWPGPFWARGPTTARLTASGVWCSGRVTTAPSNLSRPGSRWGASLPSWTSSSQSLCSRKIMSDPRRAPTASMMGSTASCGRATGPPTSTT